MIVKRIVASIVVGVIITIAGFWFILFHAPVGIAIWLVQKTGISAPNAVLNLTYLAVNIVCWAVVAYGVLAAMARRHNRASVAR